MKIKNWSTIEDIYIDDSVTQFYGNKITGMQIGIVKDKNDYRVVYTKNHKDSKGVGVNFLTLKEAKKFMYKFMRDYVI